VSNWMCDHVTPGFEMTIKGPGGRFSWARDPAQKVAFLSGGSGVTPLLSMTRYLADRGADVDVIFFHFARAPEDIICDDELSVYERTMKSFRRVYCYSRLEEGAGWKGLRGYIDADKLRSTIPDILTRNVYLCGPVPFMTGAKTSLEALRFPMGQFFQESFGGAPAGGKAPPVSAERERNHQTEDLAALLPTPSDSAREGRNTSRPSLISETKKLPITNEIGAEPRATTSSESSPASSGKAEPETVGDVVVFVKSGVTAVVNEGDMLLDVAEEAGVEIESSCRSGTCGTCTVRKLSGEVEMEVEDGLDDESREAGFVLSCVGRVKGRVEIDV
jgi:ferredoxin-NADP reductase/ferredoxin